MPEIEKASVKAPLVAPQERVEKHHGAAPDRIRPATATAPGEDLAHDPKIKAQAHVTASVTETPSPVDEHAAAFFATPDRPSWFNSVARDTLKSWGLHSLWVILRSFHDQALSRNRVVIFRHRGVAFLAAGVHLVPVLASGVIAWLLFTERWVGDSLGSHVDLAIQIATKALEVFMMASLSAMIFTFVRYEVSLGKGAPLAAYLAGGAIRSPSYIISDELWGMVQGHFSSPRKKMSFIAFSLFCCVVASLTAPFTATALRPINDWFTVGGTSFHIDFREYPIGLPVITSNSTFGGGVCAVAGNASCPSAGWESLLPLAALLSSPSGIPGIWPIPYSEGTMQIVIRARQDSKVFPQGDRDSRILLPHRAVALAIGRVVRHFEKALMKMQSEEGQWLRGSQSRYWTFAAQAGVITRCQVTVARQDALLQEGSLSVVFPDVRSDNIAELYRNMTIRNSGLDRFLASRNSSTPQLFFFDPDDGLAQNVSIATVVSLPLRGESSSPSALYGCVSNTKWVEMDLRTTQDLQMTGPAQPSTVGWERRYYLPTTMHTSYANLIDVPLEPSSGTTVFQRLATAAGMGLAGTGTAGGIDTTTAEYRTSEGAVGQVESLINLLLANGMSNTGAGAQPLLELKNKDGAWWRDFFPFVPRLGVDQLRDVLMLKGGDAVLNSYRGAFAVPEQPQAQLLSLWFNAAMFGYGYSYLASGVSYRLMWLFAYAAVAVAFTAWSVLVTGVSSSSWDSPIEVVALALRSPRPGDDVMPTSLIEEPRVLGERYCVVADDQDLSLRPVRGDGSVPEGMRVRPNHEYR